MTAMPMPRPSLYFFLCLILALTTAPNLSAFDADPHDASVAVFAFGSNRDGKTGLGLDDGGTLIATQVASSAFGTDLPSQVSASVSGISTHSLVLGESGDVYAFGSNFQGQTGLNTTIGETLTPMPIDRSILGSTSIQQVSAGWEHSLLLTEDGDVYSFGTNLDGRTGLGTEDGVTVVATPIITDHLSNVVFTQIAAGGLHSMLLDEDGVAYAFGWNSVGQAGVGTVGDDVLVATPVDTTHIGDRRITQLSGGSDFNLLLAEDGTVFAFGSNNGGKTGLGLASGSTAIPTPIDLSNLQGKTVEAVSAGGLHGLLLADDGTVYSFGGNTLGSTGQGTNMGDTLVATLIDDSMLGGRKIAQISAGSVHSLLLAEDGTVFSFGRNSRGQTGLGTEFQSTTVATPIVDSNLTDFQVVQIAAGDAYSLLLANRIPEPSSALLAALAVASIVVTRVRRS